MKNKILIIVLIALSLNTNAQTKKDSTNKTPYMLCFGYGIHNMQKEIYSGMFSESTFHTLGTFHSKFEYFLNNKTSIGVTFNYAAIQVENESRLNLLSNYHPAGYTTYNVYRSLSINARINTLLYSKNGFDIYHGFGAGNQFNTNISQSDNVSHSNKIGVETSFGFRYSNTPGFGVFAELGFTKALLQVGCFFKF
jgi:hypothetical protein